MLGSGWGAASFIKALPSNIRARYEVVLVSPRNYFLYTPLLPAVATGTMEERSIVEPIRRLVQGKAEYYEATCKYIYPQEKELVCCSPNDDGNSAAMFTVPYDILLVGVGCITNTFGIQGVDKYCSFFKTVADAHALRRRVNECFERAALPNTPCEERRRLLSFVVVGGGPTGVEVAAELHDMIHQDMAHIYPGVVGDVEIKVVELMDRVLATYDPKVGAYTTEMFKREGIDLMLNSCVSGVRDGYVRVVDKSGVQQEVPFGACVWATGIAMNPLVRQLQQLLPGQSHPRCLITDDHMMVKGSGGSIFAFGDAAAVELPHAADVAEQLFDSASHREEGLLSLSELKEVLKKGAKTLPHLEAHARFLEGKLLRFGGPMLKVVLGQDPVLEPLDETTQLNKAQFTELLSAIDKTVKPLAPTAQVAKQEGEYLAHLLSHTKLWGTQDTDAQLQQRNPFKYSHKGSLAYVGDDRAVMDVPNLGPFMGPVTGLLWKGYETMAQISARNQMLVAFDWIKAKAFGRDYSRV